MKLAREHAHIRATVLGMVGVGSTTLAPFSQVMYRGASQTLA